MNNLNYEQILQFLNSPGQWLDKYQFLKEKVSNHPLKENFDALFIYCLIKTKVDIKNFSDVIKSIYENGQEVEKTLKNFFSLKTNYLLLNRYIQQDKYNNNYSIDDNLGYLFITLNNNKISLDQDNIDYLCVLVKEIPKKELLLNTGFHNFFKNLVVNMHIGNNEPMSKLSKEIYENTTINSLQNDDDLLVVLFNQLGINSFMKDYKKSIYESLSKIIPGIKKILESLLFKPDNSSLALNFNILNFCIKSGVNVIDMIHNRFNYKYDQYVTTGSILPDLKHYQDLIYEFAPTLYSYFENNHYDLDCSAIDIQKNFYQNYILLKLLELKIDQKHDVMISEEKIVYIVNLFNKPENPSLSFNLYSVHHYLKENTIVPYLKTYLMQQRLDKNLAQKYTEDSVRTKI